MKYIVDEMSSCDRYEAINLLLSLIYYYSALFSQDFETTINELTTKHNRE